MYRRALPFVAALLMAGACAAPGAWWQADLRAWEGAPVAELLDAWGPPLRTLTEDEGRAVLVYDRVRELDTRAEARLDLTRPIGEEPPGARFTPVDRSECTIFFEVEAERVRSTRYEGAACDIIPRDPARRRPAR